MAFDIVAEIPDHIDRGFARVQEKAAQDCPHRAPLELKRRDNAKVPAAAAKRPEEILVFRSIRREHPSVRR